MSAPHEHLPVRPVVFGALLVLRTGPSHGFGIMERVNGRLGEHALVGPGTLYRTLKEMRDRGLIAHVEPPSDEDDVDGRRQYYALTDLGRSVCEAEARRVAELLSAADLGGLLPDSSR